MIRPERQAIEGERLRLSPHLLAVLQALLVTFLWSTSWVLIKIGLKDIPAVTFAGLRYALAFMFLAPFALRGKGLSELRTMTRGTWIRLVGLGLLLYTLTQGLQFVSLQYLPAATVSLMLSFTTVLVAFLGIGLLRERPAPLQWAGGGLYLAGALLYFSPLALPEGEVIGMAAALVGVAANALASILGRSVNRSAQVEPVTITTISMGVGAVVLLAGGIGLQGLPSLKLGQWMIVFWLAIINSAFAFTLWNRTLRTLSAMESAAINNTMLFQIAILAWVFLGEKLGGREIAALVVAMVGTLLVQMKKPFSGGKARAQSRDDK